jgi:hypothetical protein
MLAGCGSHGGTTASGGACVNYGEFTFGAAHHEPTPTEISVVTVDRSGQHVVSVPGLDATVTPAASVTTGPEPLLSVVIAKYKADEFLNTVPGPPAAASPANMPNGTWLVYRGVELYSIQYNSTCLDSTPPEPMSGTITTWSDERSGTINCLDPVIDDPLEAKVDSHCPKPKPAG